VRFGPLGQLAFHDVLQAGVKGQHHIQAIARRHVLVAVRDQFMMLFVQFRFPPARKPRQLGVE
jgi:hypothetical protein